MFPCASRFRPGRTPRAPRVARILQIDATDPACGVGTPCFLPPILAPFDVRLVLAANSLVPYDPTALFPAATPAPYAITLPAGLAFPLRVAAQGVVFDPTGILRTNAILLDVK